MPTAIILGSGMVGSVMAADLAADQNFKVTIADHSREALDRAKSVALNIRNSPLSTVLADLSDPETVKCLVAPHDIVLGALASMIGFQTLRAVIEVGKPYCDISFMPENALELDELAKERGVTAIVDCGVAPGMSNLLAGHGASTLDRTERIEIYVGGLPREPKWPFMYKAAFSPADVIEEYTRPARIVENGKIVTREALSEPELIHFDGVGELEAFNTDGLRSLAYTMDAGFMTEKTLRWPGHIEIMRILRAMGLFRKEPITIDYSSRNTAGHFRPASHAPDFIRPIDVTSALLFPMWTYEDGEEDFTVMRVVVEGMKDGQRRRLTWNMLDFYDQESNATSMARTTAFPCTILARMLLDSPLGPGVIVPEMIGRDAARVQNVLDELEERGVKFHFDECRDHATI